MKMKAIQKLMAAVLSVALVAAPSMSVFAIDSSGPVVDTSSSCGGDSSCETSAPATTEEEVIAIVNAAVVNAVAVEENNGGGTVSTIAEIPTTSAVAGTRTTLAGVYMATSVNGTAITTSLADIASGYGLAAGEKPYARIYNMDTKKSPLAAAAINQAAEAAGAVVGPYINVELGKMSGGKFALLSSEGAAITLKFGIPKSFAQADKTFAVVCVRPGGAVTILEDVDTNPDTITFNTTGGQGAYAIIKY